MPTNLDNVQRARSVKKVCLLMCISVSLLFLCERARADGADDDTKTAPCPGQPVSLAELREAFSEGELPTAARMTGTWVGIGFFGATETPELRMINCAGNFRQDANAFEEVLVAKGYAITVHNVGTFVQGPTVEISAGALTFPFDFGGDSHPVYRCRLTKRNTLACLIDVYQEGIEFKRMTVKAEYVWK
jgi:hypothetical protein